MNNDEFYEFEDRAYINPTLSSSEQESFINSLRDLQGQNNAQIAEQTYNLGTSVPSNLGGLGGGEAYFTSRYQTPQVGEMVSTLKSAAQAQALNDVLNNYQSQLKQQYNQAYRNAQKRQRARQNAYYNSLLGGGGGGGDGNNPGLDITTNGPKSGGFWDTTIGKMTNKWIGDVLEKGGAISTGGSNWEAVGNNVYRNKQTGATYNTNVPTSLTGIMAGGSSNLGVWPNGQKMVEGSTYNWGGKTYTVVRGLSGNNYDIVEIV